jgi:hypothetical protein
MIASWIALPQTRLAIVAVAALAVGFTMRTATADNASGVTTTTTVVGYGTSSVDTILPNASTDSFKKVFPVKDRPVFFVVTEKGATGYNRRNDGLAQIFEMKFTSGFVALDVLDDGRTVVIATKKVVEVVSLDAVTQTTVNRPEPGRRLSNDR